MINNRLVFESSSGEFLSESSDRTNLSSTLGDDDDDETEASDSYGEEKQYDSKDASMWLSVTKFTLVITAVSVMLLIYVSINDEEIAGFEVAYLHGADALVEALSFRTKATLRAIESMSDGLTSMSVHDKVQWPFLTIPHFDARGESYIDEATTEMLAFSPIVVDKEKIPWEYYGLKNKYWIDGKSNDFAVTDSQQISVHKQIFTYNENATTTVPIDSMGPYAPLWQIYPFQPSVINYDMLSNNITGNRISAMILEKHLATTEVLFTNSTTSTFLNNQVDSSSSSNISQTILFQPVFQSFDADSDVVGYLSTIIDWGRYLSELVAEDQIGICVVLQNTCGPQYTYMINGPQAIFVGSGDLHDPNYDRLLVTKKSIWGDGLNNNTNSSQLDLCEYTIDVYPTDVYRYQHTTSRPEAFALTTGAFFLIIVVVFYFYVRIVHNRQEKLVETAARTSKIVSSLFPANVRDRIMREAEIKLNLSQSKPIHTRSLVSARSGVFGKSNADRANLLPQVTQFREQSIKPANGVSPYSSKPIADLFPETTVLFADMVGFTAWSSAREPTQVFELLETIYHSFDKMAKKRRVFKVETIGDCYVAVTGLPEPMKHHAVTMAYFANDCLRKMGDLTNRLEMALGPDTADLTMRIGLHSGPVTAGVLRGAKSRFQLFGDTVNTAARMESNGARDRIHVSESTARLLIAAGKSQWIEPREEKIVAKGKGEMQTYWINVVRTNYAGDETRSQVSDSDSSSSDESDASSRTGTRTKKSVRSKDSGRRKQLTKTQRLVEWNVDQLLGLLEKIVGKRSATGFQDLTAAEGFDLRTKSRIINDVTDAIPPAEMSRTSSRLSQRNRTSFRLDENVVRQLHDYIEAIALFYRDNPFHNFSHASHVAMSVTKLIHRIVDRDESESTSFAGSDSFVIDQGFMSMFNQEDIVSDPLVQFALLLSALVHDMEHVGVPNSQLVTEKAKTAVLYENKSIHEQASLDLAFEILMDDKFKILRSTIYSTESEFNRFRQIMVNSVMATDMLDSKQLARHKERWETASAAFQERRESNISAIGKHYNFKATVLIEQLMQASDVSHCMQHWHVFRKWNEFLFQEQYIAYNAGRGELDPVETWYEEELKFFDDFVIPLATALTESGAFGSNCHEYLTYAQSNRAEWVDKGQSEINAMVDRIKGEQPAIPVMKENFDDELHVSY